MFKHTYMLSCGNVAAAAAAAAAAAGTMARLFHGFFQKDATSGLPIYGILWLQIASLCLPKYDGRWPQRTVTAVGQK